MYSCRKILRRASSLAWAILLPKRMGQLKTPLKGVEVLNFHSASPPHQPLQDPKTRRHRHMVPSIFASFILACTLFFPFFHFKNESGFMNIGYGQEEQMDVTRKSKKPQALHKVDCGKERKREEGKEWKHEKEKGREMEGEKDEGGRESSRRKAQSAGTRGKCSFRCHYQEEQAPLPSSAHYLFASYPPILIRTYILLLHLPSPCLFLILFCSPRGLDFFILVLLTSRLSFRASFPVKIGRRKKESQRRWIVAITESDFQDLDSTSSTLSTARQRLTLTVIPGPSVRFSCALAGSLSLYLSPRFVKTIWNWAMARSVQPSRRRRKVEARSLEQHRKIGSSYSSRFYSRIVYCKLQSL